jgi:hypothetical protein
MAWCGEGELGELWQAAGLRDVHFRPLVVPATYADVDDLWSPLPTGVGPSGACCKSLDEDRRAALCGAVRHRLGLGDERFELSGTSRRPSQRSRAARDSSPRPRTLGLNVVGRASGGSIRSSSLAPSRSSPLIRGMKGFHSG